MMSFNRASRYIDDISVIKVCYRKNRLVTNSQAQIQRKNRPAADLAVVRRKKYMLLNKDCQWHRPWSESLVRMAIEDNVRNRQTIQEWINRWRPLGARAVPTFASLLGDTLQQWGTLPPQRIVEALDRDYRDYLQLEVVL